MSKLKILVAYPYLTKNVLDAIRHRHKDIDLLVDSGAFTAWKAKSFIALDDYCRFIEALPIEPWGYFSLDVIGDPKQSMINYETMLRRGFKPIPIFTRGDDVMALEEYYSRSNVVGIGGLVGTRGNKGFVKGVMERVGDRKCHWLGFSSLDFVKVYKPFGCDSSSLTASCRYGQVSLFCDKTKKFIVLTKKNFLKRPPNYIYDLIKSYGVDPIDLSKKNNWRFPWAINAKITYKSYVRAQKFLSKLKINYFLVPLGAVLQPHFDFIMEANDHENNLLSKRRG